MPVGPKNADCPTAPIPRTVNVSREGNTEKSRATCIKALAMGLESGVEFVVCAATGRSHMKSTRARKNAPPFAPFRDRGTLKTTDTNQNR
jgi:hypothetical protein